MQKIFDNPAELEKLAKEKYAVPQFLMMENAAKAMAAFIENHLPADKKTPPTLTIVCGKGNNGGDGYAVARLLQDKCKVTIFSIEPAASEEAKVQYEMCRRLGLTFSENIGKPDFLLDCIYGTGFRGELSPQVKAIIDEMNKSPALKIACDIPSGLYFNADYTITMGCQKLTLYSDKAKAVCGKIIVADLGISREKFEQAAVESAENSSASSIYLVEPSDMLLPYRKNRAAHKGCYGHTAVFSGDKGGACILAASAAMKFGSGLTTIINHTGAELSQFKIPPSLMISDKLPKKTSCILLGPGVIDHNLSDDQMIGDYFRNGNKTHAAVFDAGVFDMKGYIEEIKTYSQEASNQIVLTPHLSELQRFLKRVREFYPEVFYTEEEISIESLANSPETKIKIGREINRLFPNAALIMKSANTFIAYQGNTYIITDGCQNLAKGGSGDILAGLTAALLAQGYSAKDAAITAAEYHAQLSHKIDEQAFNLTPEKLLEYTSFIS